MVKFTKTQMEFLQRFEDNMRTATYSDYIRAVAWQDISDVAGIWQDASGEEYKPERGCASCTLALFKKVGEVYFDQLKQKGQTKSKSKKEVKDEK